MSPAKKQKQPDELRPTNEADRRWVLDLLDGVKELHESALPGTNGEELLYFANLSAIRQLTEIYYRQLLKPHRISYSEFRILSSLRIRGRTFKTTPLDLNRYTQMTSAGMTRTLDRLEKAAHIERSPNPDDRRSVLVGLTDSGWDFAETVFQDVTGHYSDALEGVRSRDLKAENDSLRIVVERLTNAVIR